METSPDDLLDLPSAITLVSTLVDTLSSYSSVIPHDVAHVSFSSHDDELGRSTTASGPPSSSHPIFHFDEDIMEALTDPDILWDDMHHRTYFLP